jgi:hypothetical protein
MTEHLLTKQTSKIRQPIGPILVVPQWVKLSDEIRDHQLSHTVEKFLLVGKVPVQRWILNIQLCGEATHRQPVESNLIHQLQSGASHRFSL